MALKFAYQFFPVGQGLFSYGELGSGDPKSRRRIRWVYDCGTTSSQDLLERQLDELVKQQDGNDRLDLLFISHFDKDHISGVAKFLGKFKVGAILLPYMTPEQLLVHAIQSGTEPGDAEFRFFINPSDFLADSGSEKGVERIVYVPPSDGEGPELPDYPDAPDDDNIGDLNIPTTELPAGSDHLRVSSGRSTTTVQQLAPRAAIRSGRVWEFVMYNDAPPEDLLGLDVTAVKAQRQVLMDSKEERSREDAMEEIKRLFEEKLRSGLMKNLISLFVYAGPAFSRRWGGYVAVHASASNPMTIWLHEMPPFAPRGGVTSWVHGGVLYTGDGYLNEAPRLTRMTRYFRGMRIARTNVLQVMHHGAKDNWHEGVAAALHPHLSIFSSDPGHRGYRHPHPPVSRDFEPYNPIQVDRTNGCQIEYRIH